MVQIGALRNRQAIAIGEGGGDRFTLTPDVAYAFDVPDTDWISRPDGRTHHGSHRQAERLDGFIIV